MILPKFHVVYSSGYSAIIRNKSDAERSYYIIAGTKVAKYILIKDYYEQRLVDYGLNFQNMTHINTR